MLPTNVLFSADANCPAGQKLRRTSALAACLRKRASSAVRPGAQPPMLAVAYVISVEAPGAHGAYSRRVRRVHVSVEQHGDVALVRIDRPPANALDLFFNDAGPAEISALSLPDPRLL